ncbi:MAG TPA: ATPase, T2SS/T4P/T4SS family [Pirellulaceae bacterium]|nr:ATPase, T2SS/T4P/T4SS family [Pirellulaceae bacterium]
MSKKQEEPQKLPHEYFPPIVFNAAGPDKLSQQANQIQVKNSPFYTYAMALTAEALLKRADILALEYTRDSVAVRISVDGVPYDLQPRDRQVGDGLLACFKKLGHLNIAERRAKQEAKLGVEFQGQKYNLYFTSQGVPTGERVLIKFTAKKFPFSSLEDLGMRDKLREQYKQVVNAHSGLVVISAPPGGGLTTSWKVALEAADRFVRDFICVVDAKSTDEEMINITPCKFNAAGGETPDQVLPKLLLKQPDVLVVPEMMNFETCKLLVDQVNNEHKMAITRIQAKEAVEALLRVVQQFKPPIEDFAKAVTMVVNQRLIRKLCDCKQPFQPTPDLLQRLGIPPGRVQMLYREWQPPPPPPPDQKGKVEEPQICQKCNGIGYYGRTAIFELLVINDAIREALVKRPQIEVLRQLARQAGTRTIQEEGVLLVAKGVTSIPELQRVLKL